MNNKGFTLICNSCGNRVELENCFNRKEKSIYIGTFMSCDISCDQCDNRIDEDLFI